MHHTLHITVAGKVATYSARDGSIICGNDDYQVQFALDSGWDGLKAKARFRWNGKHKDVPIVDGLAAVPRITNAHEVKVGVYSEDGSLKTTTAARVPCDKSILCGDSAPTEGNEAHYASEAQEAAERAEAAAKRAEAAGGSGGGTGGGVMIDPESVNQAQEAAQAALESAEAAGQSAEEAETSKNQATAARDAAEAAKGEAKNAAQEAATAQSGAREAAAAAEGSAGQAEESAAAAEAAKKAAQAAKNTAEQKAAEAGESAAGAATSAEAAEAAQGAAEAAKVEAGQKAAAAENAAQEAASKATAAQTAQGKAETAQGKAEAAQAATESAKAEVEQKLANGDYKGEDGVSPIVEVTDTPKSVTITIIGADGSRQTGAVSIADLEQNLRAEIAAEWANRGTVTITAITSLDEIDQTDSVEAHSKLYLYEGNLYAYMRSPKPGGDPLFTNALNDPSVTKKINTRWSDSGNKESTNNGYYLIHNIPATAGQTVYVNLPRSAFSAWYSRVQYHDVNKAYVSATTTYATQKYKITTDADGVSSFVVGYQNTTAGDDSTNALVANSANIRYIVLVLCVSAVISPDGAQGNTLTEDDVADLIVSVGNPIAYSEPDPNNWEWKAAMAFPNIDGLSNKVAALEATSVDHETRIYEVEQAIANGGIVEESLTDSEKLARIKTWNRVVTDKAPVTLIAANRMKPAMTEADRTVVAIHNKYTALAEKYPSLITKTVLGPCTSTEDFPAVDMLRIDVKETDGERNAVRNQYMPKRKIILLAGIHWEWVGIGALYHFIEEVAENPDYGDIRSNAHLIVVPVANPYGATSKVNCPYDAPGHVNANGVAIHNNFGVDHIAGGTVGTYNYGGTAPYSELETQYIDSIMAENPDAVAFISCHNCDGDGSYGTGVMWASVASAYTANVAYHVVDKMSDAWYGKYGEDLLTAIDTYKTADLPKGDRCLGRVSLSTSAGTEQKNALKYGIQGLNFEVTHNMPVFSGTTSYTTETMTHATEVYANLVRTVLAAFEESDKTAQYKKS